MLHPVLKKIYILPRITIAEELCCLTHRTSVQEKKKIKEYKFLFEGKKCSNFYSEPHMKKKWP